MVMPLFGGASLKLKERSVRNRPPNYYVRDRNSGDKILVTAVTAHEYRDSCRYIRLDEPAPQDVDADVPVPDLRKRSSVVINADEQEKPKAAPTKKAAKKS
jgi:hypothetical protein